MKSKLHKILVLISLNLIFLFTSCKSTEEIQRQEMFNQMAIQLEANNKLTAELVTRVSDLETQVNQITGKVEESQYKNEQLVKENINKITENISTISEKLKNNDKELIQAKQRLKQQNKYIKNINSAISGAATSSKKTSLYDQAMSNYKRGRYKTALKQLATVLKENKVKGNQKARVLHNMGIIHFMNKKYDNSLTYLSRVLTEHGKTGYVKNALFYIGKSFSAQGKTKEANAAFNRVIKKYPSSSQAKQAKKLLK